MQVTLRLKPHNTDTNGIDSSVRVTMSVQKKREGVFFIFLPLKRGGELLERGARLQNSLYFCVFKYGRPVKQKVWNEAENRERDWGEMQGVWGSHASRA